MLLSKQTVSHFHPAFFLFAIRHEETELFILAYLIFSDLKCSDTSLEENVEQNTNFPINSHEMKYSKVRVSADIDYSISSVTATIYGKRK